MKTISGNLLAHIQGRVTTTAMLWTITRRDGEVVRLTDHDRPITYDGATYTPVNSFTRTDIAASAGLAVDNVELVALIDSDNITAEDLRGGKFRDAAFIARELNYEAPADGAITLRCGTLGESTLEGEVVTVDFRGLAQKLQQNVGRLYSRRCDADLGDSRCTVNIAALTETDSVASAVSRAAFIAATLARPDGYFNFGLASWTSGANAGLAMEVKRWTSATKTVELFIPMPYTVAAGDSFSIYPGCDKNFSTCRDTFANAPNFRGFHLAPGRDQAMRYPDSPY